MDEEKIIGTEVTDTDLAAFDEDWGDSQGTEDAGEPEEEANTSAGESGGDGGVTETGEGSGTTTNQSEGGEAQTGEDGTAETQTAEGEEKAENQRFDLTYMHETRSVDRNEVISLAQKGLDYDRIRARYDDLNGQVTELGGIDTLHSFASLLKELAGNGKMTTEQALDSTWAAVIARRDNVGMDVALERAKYERLSREREDRTNRETAERTARQKAEDDRQKELAAFVKAYPNVEANKVPREVWDAFTAGESLISAYARYETKAARAENAELRTQLEALKKNETNRKRAAGSQQGAGDANTKTDPFDEGWDD